MASGNPGAVQNVIAQIPFMAYPISTCKVLWDDVRLPAHRVSYYVLWSGTVKVNIGISAMANEPLSYRDLEYLTQDTLDDSLIVEACEWFLQQDTTEDATLYATAKLKTNQSSLRGIPDLGALQAYKDLIALADTHNDNALKAFSRVKAIFAAADFTLLRLSPDSDTSREDLFRLISNVIGRSVQDDDEFGRIKLELFCDGLGRALGSQVLDVPSAIEAAKHTRLPDNDPMLIPFVAAAVGFANEISRTDLDEGYQILSHVSVQTPDTMYPRMSAILNRLARYVNDNAQSAIPQAKEVVKDVSDFCNNSARNEAYSNYSQLPSDILRRKKDSLRISMDNITKLIERLESEVASPSTTKTQIADALTSSSFVGKACHMVNRIAALATP